MHTITVQVWVTSVVPAVRREPGPGLAALPRPHGGGGGGGQEGRGEALQVGGRLRTFLRRNNVVLFTAMPSWRPR